MSYKLAISSMSLGRGVAGHDLQDKLDMAAKYGYEGVEIFYEDLADQARRWAEEDGSPPDLLAAARCVRGLCDERGLKVICLQPFAQFEGLLDRAEHARRLRELAAWLDLARALGTDLVALASSFLPAGQVSDSLGLIVADLREAADLAAGAGVRLSYESLCWGTRVDDWEACYDVVCKVDRPNFGMCLDTFNIAGRLYADPTSPTGKLPHADEAVRRSMARLIGRVDADKVFYVQVVDAERLASPLTPSHPFHQPGLPARMSWSRNCRLFYGEEDRGAFLPVRGIAWACLRGIGYEGWVSMELYNRRMGDADRGVPEELARRGAVAWEKLVADMRVPDYQYDSSLRSTPESP
ncbi:uncharacterized protein E0L32_010819 [Thyridium curvatum]|uniref:Xylose isomerase-like TIM barrel domain-containing protein n=1 Tax=Thyridium curvatum TaxID=1093900 RepID=A0A507ADR2_9PEZI|nr:uncharacterized protein E0L32_010819 [Thyridium curvatum]TPX07225.1 hypothetical protein E0L32_010819 [Thyridium curvatum]